MVDWDDYQDVRIHAVAPLPNHSFERAVEVLSRYESPKWPMWFPLCAYASEDARIYVDSQINELLANSGVPVVLLAASQWVMRF
jgi:hypothetical protein